MAMENPWHILTLVTHAKHPLTVHLSGTGESPVVAASSGLTFAQVADRCGTAAV